MTINYDLETWLMKFTNKNNFFFNLSYVFNVLFCKRILSYFAKPNFIIYDKWFDDNLEKAKHDVKNKKIKAISNLHDFFMSNQITKLVILKITCN